MRRFSKLTAILLAVLMVAMLPASVLASDVTSLKDKAIYDEVYNS